jgi:hypothetical protein
MLHLIFLSFFTLSAVNWAYAQQRPVPPSVEGCRAYLHQLIKRMSALNEKSLSCMSHTDPHIVFHVQVCNYSGHRMVDGYQAWPQCSNDAEECQLLDAEKDAYSCLDEAYAKNATDTEKRMRTVESLNKAESAVKELHSNFNNIKRAWDDPMQFMKEKIGSRVQSELIPKLDDGTGHFTHRGEKLTQETYDYIFKKTIGNKSLMSSNPIIQAIQGSAAEEINKAFSDSIYQMDQLQKSMSDVSLPPTWRGENQSSKPQPAVRSTQQARSKSGDDCGLLDGPGHADLAMDEPEKYAELIRRCPPIKSR